MTDTKYCIHCNKPVDRKIAKFHQPECQQCFDASNRYDEDLRNNKL